MPAPERLDCPCRSARGRSGIAGPRTAAVRQRRIVSNCPVWGKRKMNEGEIRHAHSIHSISTSARIAVQCDSARKIPRFSQRIRRRSSRFAQVISVGELFSGKRLWKLWKKFHNLRKSQRQILRPITALPRISASAVGGTQICPWDRCQSGYGPFRAEFRGLQAALRPG
jgi:hypothetical protein